jgi:hypothetical protein
MNQKLPIPPLKAVRLQLEKGIDSFLHGEAKLFEALIGERALTGTLALLYLRDMFAPWDVDPEYDRFGDVRKRSPIESRGKSKNLRGHLVTPDIIVHQKLHPTYNLLAIEAKSEDDPRGDVEDREKLASYLVKPLCYEYAALLIFSATKEPACGYELFQRGEDPKTPKQSIKRTAPRYQA